MMIGLLKHTKIIDWEISLDKRGDNQINEMVYSQKKEANRKFSDFIKKNYSEWSLNNNGPTMSHTLLKKKFFHI